MDIKELKKKKIGFVSFGCGKNVVEIEKIISKCKDFGFTIVSDEKEANILVVNSCAFLKSTRKESFDCIKDFAELKKYNLEKIILTGCLAGYKLDNIEKQLTGVDLILSQEMHPNIIKEIANLYNLTLDKKFDNFSRVLTTPSHYAYLRIADGCDNFCTYCTIPYIVGRYRSIPQEQLVMEASRLVNGGVSELIVVAQDITIYGSDLKDGTSLVTLIRELSKLEKLKHIRLIYCYPENITSELIKEIKNNEKVCKYLDIPMQHISNSVLKRMNRKNTKEKTIELIKLLRKEIKDIALRSTFIVGFPGETEEEFNELCDFVKDYKLNQLGFFAYSREKGTIAYSLKPQILEKVKKERVKTLAKLQYKNVIDNNNKYLNKTLTAVVDEVGCDYALLRSQYQLPDLDGRIVIINPIGLNQGEYVKVKIISVDGYDLIGKIVK